MDKKIRQLITRIKNHLIQLNGEKIKKVILYDSYARGEATKDSNIGVLVVVDDSLDPSEVRKSLSDIIFRYSSRKWRTDFRCSSA
ncbi:MAG: nucleotidyltransferase domain-containing protein [Euryarchaeota archaeon]|nr:nucleotidyltransferase domain-containing protein [Euryarchaeota archaeon]